MTEVKKLGVSRKKNEADKIILGENVVYAADSQETGLNNNILVVGCSGCGKTMSVTEARLLETFRDNLIITVTKRRIVDKYKKVFEDRGYEVHDLNFIEPKKSTIAYDPLAYVQSYADIKFLAEAIVQSNPKKDEVNKADPYWDEAASSLLAAEISYILMTKEKNQRSFVDVLDFHGKLTFRERGNQIITSHDSKFKELEEKSPNCYAVSCWRSFCNLPVTTAGCVFSTLNTTIDTLFSPEIRMMITKKKKVDFERLAKKKSILFLSSSAVNPALHCFVNMFYGEAFKRLFEYAEKQPDGKLPIPIHVLCDDFATGSRIYNFPEYISVFREKQISVTLLLQSESQLENMYGNAAATIIENCDTYVYMGGMDLRTGKSISERLNAPLEDVLYMPVGSEYVFRRGNKPIVTTRYNVMDNTLFQEITKQYERTVARLQR